MQMNRQWMYGNRLSGEFTTGLKDFLVVANANKQGGFVICPCVNCKNQKGYSSSRDVHMHLLRHGFMPSYNCWTKHGERGVIMEEDEKGMISSMKAILLISVILSWRMLKVKGKVKGKVKKRHVMSPLMILVGPLLMHGDAAKLKRRGRIWIAC